MKQNRYPVEEGKTYTASCEKRFGFTCPDTGYQVVQGAYYDGKKYVFAMKRNWPDGHESIRLMETDPDGKLIRLSEDKKELQHGNNINYNPKRNQYIVTHCMPQYDGCSFVDADTFEVVSSHQLGTVFYEISYDPVNDCYVSACDDSVDVWDADLNKIDSLDPPVHGPLPQGGFADDRYLYLPRSSLNGFGAEILVIDYKVTKKQAFRIPLDVSDTVEPEDLNIVDGEIYLVSNHPDYPSGGVVYHVTLHETQNEVQ